MTSSGYACSLETINEARQTIAPYAVITPILTNQTLDDMSGRKLFFKCELFQRSGSFKFRGACNSVFLIPGDEAPNGVVTHSSGNHGAALSLAAKLRGIPAHIVVPDATPKIKVDRIKQNGGTVHSCGRTMEIRADACKKVQEETQSTFVSSHNCSPVISGQGTIALEILEQIGDGSVDAVVVPVSCGGLLSGIAYTIKSINPDIKVIAAEPTGTNDAADAAKSMEMGNLVDCPYPKTVADGLMGRLGDATWPLIRDFVDDVVTVSEEQILDATRLCYQELKVAAEPSGAVPLAAVLSDSFQTNSKFSDCSRICLIVSGGNVDLEEKDLWNPEKWAPLS